MLTSISFHVFFHIWSYKMSMKIKPRDRSCSNRLTVTRSYHRIFSSVSPFSIMSVGRTSSVGGRKPCPLLPGWGPITLNQGSRSKSPWSVGFSFGSGIGVAEGLHSKLKKKSYCCLTSPARWLTRLPKTAIYCLDLTAFAQQIITCKIWYVTDVLMQSYIKRTFISCNEMDSFLTYEHNFYIIPYETCSKTNTVANNLKCSIWDKWKNSTDMWSLCLNDIHKTRVFDIFENFDDMNYIAMYCTHIATMYTV